MQICKMSLQETAFGITLIALFNLHLSRATAPLPRLIFEPYHRTPQKTSLAIVLAYCQAVIAFTPTCMGFYGPFQVRFRIHHIDYPRSRWDRFWAAHFGQHLRLYRQLSVGALKSLREHGRLVIMRVLVATNIIFAHSSPGRVQTHAIS